ELTPDDNRSMYIGAYNTFMGLATAVGPSPRRVYRRELLGLRSIFLFSFGVGEWWACSCLTGEYQILATGAQLGMT
ncbi:MAG: hypothetical protein ACOX48_05825, partial [Limnochordia bacterium]